MITTKLKWLSAVAALSGLAVLAETPLQDATVVANNSYDSQVASAYGLKVSSVDSKARVIVLKNAVWGMDDNNRVRFQLFTDGTLHLYNANYEETVTIDGLNGQILVNGKNIAEAR